MEAGKASWEDTECGSAFGPSVDTNIISVPY